MIKKLIALAAVAALAAGVAGQAQATAVTFNNVGDSGTIVFSELRQGATLSATFGFTLTSLNATSTQATFATSVSNNSTGPGTNRITSFGVDIVTPTLSNASTTGGVWSANINDILPSFQSVDLCLFPGKNCSGGGNGGLREGITNTFSLILTTAGSFGGGISFISPYSIKFQDVGTGGNSYEFAGCSITDRACNGGGGPKALPEPEVLALFGIGMLALGMTRRRAGHKAIQA